MTHTAAPIDRDALIARYERTRARTRELFALVSDDAYYRAPIPTRHPLVFYDGHLPAFSFNTLVKKALGGASIDGDLERLFARGIDPAEVAPRQKQSAAAVWPERRLVRQFTDEADRRVLAALAGADLDQPGHPYLERAEAVHAILEHEAMHQETLLYMWHRLPLEQKRAPAEYRPAPSGRAPVPQWVEIPAGDVTLGARRGSIPFGWDNEFGAATEHVPPFSIERYDVTNSAYLEFVDAGGYEEPRWWGPEDWSWRERERLHHPLFWQRTDGEWYWRGMFERFPLPASWPVYVSQAEAAAYACWRDARLPTEAEFQRAAFTTPRGEARQFPWGSASPTQEHGVFDFASWDPEPVGGHPAGQSAWGVEDLVGNGWEWTSTVFAPFAGFRAMASYPEYSADFFDGQHVVMKGASPATSRELLRPTFRNWFRPRYPFVYAAFRCARSA
ncbi:MAG: ergothioneine biosynthesis protein EgtB [Acidobacteria bacterium]|nr:ergothioneine biosynthesis protein EgtB [Acidobacteriota bacterium]